jgi:hypothetical protein
MLEELRDHDPKPSSQEREWMQADPFRVLVRVAALAVIAFAIGATASTLNTGPGLHAVVATAP